MNNKRKKSAEADFFYIYIILILQKTHHRNIRISFAR